MSDERKGLKKVRTFGRKKNATAVALCEDGFGLVRVNGKPLQLIEPASMRTKAFEPFFLVGANKYKDLTIRVRVRGGGSTAQVLAVRQAVAKALIAYYQRFEDEQSKLELKDLFLQYDKSLLVSDSRRCEPKKFGGRGARARFQKSYR